MAVDRHTPIDELPQFLTVPEVCTYFALGRSTVYDLIRRGELQASRFGRVLRIPREAIRVYVIGNDA